MYDNTHVKEGGRRPALAVTMLACLLAAPSLARAQDKTEPTYIAPPIVTKEKKDAEKDEKDKKKKKQPKQGWIPTLKTGFNFSFNQARNVVGVADGTTIALGLLLDAGLTFRSGDHEWINALDIVQTHTKVPNIDPFIKSADKLDLESLYLYHIKNISWLGVFGGVRLTTPLFAGNFVPEEDTTVSIELTDGTVVQDTAEAQKYYRLTKPVAPLIFRQFIGAAFLPLEKDYLRLDIKVGTGAMEVWTRSSLVQDDNEDTADVLELRQLEDFVQGGVELHLAANGVIVKDVLSYTLKAGLMYPYVTSIDTDLSGIDLLNAEINFKLNIKLAKWASLNYALAMLRVPLIQPEWQITNNIMLSLTANLGT
jgi:hypothetical protein